jgi:DNA-binding transcriptional LysR family regulator
MELRHLRYFVAAAEEGTLTRAGERLHVVQQALSKQIAELEHELGVSLFERQPRGVRLTVAGEAFLPQARLILGQTELAVQMVRAAARTTANEIRIGCVEQGFTADLVAAARLTVQNTNGSGEPPLRCAVIYLPSAEQLLALSAARIDVAVVQGPMALPQDLTSEWVADQHLVGVIVSATSALAAYDVIPSRALRDVPGATFPREWNPDAWERVRTACDALGADLRTDEPLTSLQAALATTATRGWWVPAPELIAGLLPPSVCFRRVEGMNVPFVVEAVRRVTETAPAIAQYIRALRRAEEARLGTR